ncbi:MAG: penicillin-binding protein 2 [Anaerolineales bacterium]|nr:penicillin-binding protein 2 [Anaerolineales bacterium]
MFETVFIRLRLVLLGLAVFAGLVVFQLLRIEFGDTSAEYFRRLSSTVSEQPKEFSPQRGRIFDRDGELLVANSVQYEISAAPNAVWNVKETAAALSTVLNMSVGNLEKALRSDKAYVLIARPVEARLGDEIKKLLDEGIISGITVTPLAKREYPGASLAAQVLGFVGYNAQGRQVGYFGVEGFYNELLAGRSVQGIQQLVPFIAEPDPVVDQGADLYLTIDRDIQFLVEGVLASAVQQYGAEGGTIIVSNPRTGEILAMASFPTYDPNHYATNPPADPMNPAVSAQYEPGSTFKVLTMAAALDSGLVKLDTPFVDTGYIEVGGVPIRNWDGGVWGPTDMVGCLRHSLNVCLATLSTQLGPQTFYNYMAAFGIGHRTNVDLAAEASGRLKRPGDPDWFESDLGTNSFGQGVAVTPIQLVVAVSAIANDGVIMQPHVLKRVENNGRTHATQPQVLGRPIRPETARTLSEMLAKSLEGEAKSVKVPGYRIAGKTGTAQIPIPGGYDRTRTITSFIGWGPVDDPQFIVLVKLDKPTTSIWGSDTAAPVFSVLVQRLVVLMQIPPDRLRGSLGN